MGLGGAVDPGLRGLALALLGLFAWIEHRGRDPLMPLRLLGYRELCMAMVLTAVFMSSFGVQYYFLAVYYQQVYGYSVLLVSLANAGGSTGAAQAGGIERALWWSAAIALAGAALACGSGLAREGGVSATECID